MDARPEDTPMATPETIPARDIDPTDGRPAGWWAPADGQGEMDMTGCTVAEALAEMLGQCADDEQREGLLSGSLQVLASPAAAQDDE